MNRVYTLLAGIVSLFVIFTIPAAVAATIDYSNTSGSSINLDPTDGCGGIGSIGCFSFSSGNSIQITSGSANGFNGGISGIFGVGTIDNSLGFLETATVTGTGVLAIFDGSTSLTSDLNWLDISTFGTASSLNAMGSANLSNINYSGFNADLVTLANAGAGTQTATFQFTIPTSLTDLFTTSTMTSSTSFSGSITPVPVPAAFWLLGSGMIALVGISRRRNSA